MTNDRKITVIRPRSSLSVFDFSELVEFREILGILVWRHLKIRYKQTVIGVAWVWFQPTVMMAVYSIFFGYFARFPSGGFPYPLFVLSGIVPWLFLARAVGEAGNSLVENRGMLTRLYFPRLIMPLTAVIGCFIDMLVALVVLFAAMLYFGHWPGANVVYLPLFFIELIVLATGIAVLVSALNAVYRDFGFIVPILLQVWLFSSPVVYATELFPASWRNWYGLNPMVGILEGIRWSIGGAGGPYFLSDQAFTIGISLAVFLLAATYFRKVERTLVDKL